MPMGNLRLLMGAPPSICPLLLFLQFIQCRSLFRTLGQRIQQHGRIILLGPFAGTL